VKIARVRVLTMAASFRSVLLTPKILPKRKCMRSTRVCKLLTMAIPAAKKIRESEPNAASSLMRVSRLNNALPAAVSKPAISAPTKRANVLAPKKRNAKATPGSSECESASPIKASRRRIKMEPSNPPLRLSKTAERSPRCMNP